MIVDAHLHLWRRARGDYGWLPTDGSPLDRDFEAADAHAELQSAGVDGAVLVQAAPTMAESVFLLEIARRYAWVLGVVGWVDLMALDVAADLEQLAAQGPLVGIRPMLQTERDPDWLMRADVDRSLDALARAGLVFDALVRSHQIGAIAALAERRPELSIILDHGGKPPLDGDDLAGWQAGVTALAARPNVHCKLSGLVSESGSNWDESSLGRVIDVLVDTFGSARLIWGSDWPVCTPAIDYRRWLDTIRTLLTAQDAAAVLGGNAARLYRLEART